MEILRETNIDFLKYRRFWVTFSVLVVIAAIVAIAGGGKLNEGIDFSGGTQLTLKFRERPDIQALRDIAGNAGFREAIIQRFGDADHHEVMLRIPIVEGTEEGGGADLLAALDARFNAEAAGQPDLNRTGSDALGALLTARDPDGVGAMAGPAHYEGVADAIAALRRKVGLFTDWSQLTGAAGVSPAAASLLRSEMRLGSFAVLSLENVGPQVGAELRQRGMMAVLFSLLAMMVYIWIRFELSFGIGAIVSGMHDVLVTLGLFALFRFEFNLTTIAAFLALVGYSINDTVVIFDRVRENRRKNRTLPLADQMNRSINQTLSRTILTSGTTLLASGSLLLLGGEVIRGFAFVMTVGIIVGTYSSIFIASPFALLWEQYRGRKEKAAEKAPAAPAKVTPAAPKSAPAPNGGRPAPAGKRRRGRG